MWLEASTFAPQAQAAGGMRKARLLALGRRHLATAAAAAWLPALLVVIVVAAKANTQSIGPRASDGKEAPQHRWVAVSLAEQLAPADTDYLRWLWWPTILYLFWAMAYVCDMYFVRTIDVISERYKIPDDVAGATLMALGCNGPEMALNSIAIFHPSDIGVGAVIGGEVFNVLVIIGTALLTTPEAYLPLKIGCFSFFRDVLFYAVSVGLLYSCLKDGSVSPLDACTLLLGALAYIITVICSGRLRCYLSTCWRAQKRLLRLATVRLGTTSGGGTGSAGGLTPGGRRGAATPGRRFGGGAGTPVRAGGGTPHSSKFSTKSAFSALLDSDTDDESRPPPPSMRQQWESGASCTDPSEGSVLGVRADIRNRLMDRSHHYSERFLVLTDDALLVSTATDPRTAGLHMGRSAMGIVWDREQQGDVTHWHHGGLVNPPVYLMRQGAETCKSDHGLSKLPRPPLQVSTEDLKLPLVTPMPMLDARQVCGDSCAVVGSKDFEHMPWEVIPLEDILYCERPRVPLRFNLHVHQHGSDLRNLITLEFSSKDEAVIDAWVEALKRSLIRFRQRLGPIMPQPPPEKGGWSLLMDWVEWFQFPVRFWLMASIPDMDKTERQHLFPVSFVMSMFWLAIFAYSVVAACDGIHRDFGISTTVLGFTVAAAGTSFPNVFSGMVVARQGKTTMAVANALGANVQNVFLALAIPWTVQSCFINQGAFPLHVEHLAPAVLECYVTLLPVVLVFICCKFSMPRWSGGLYLAIYVVYLVFALGQEASGCARWPAPCRLSASG